MMKNRAGISLVELTVVVAGIAILVSLLTPVVLAVTDQTARTRAEQDACAVRDGLLQLLRDTGAPRIRTAGEEGPLVYLLVSDGRIPTAGGGDTAWIRPLTANGVVDYVERHLIGNAPAGDARNRWSLPSSPTGAGWRGAYLTGAVGSDPWGNRYAVNVGFLGAHADVVVLSAGPNGTVESPHGETGFRTLGDDLAILVK